MLSSKISTIAIFLSASFLATASISILPGVSWSLVNQIMSETHCIIDRLLKTFLAWRFSKIFYWHCIWQNDIIVTNTTIPVNDNISLKDYTAPRTWNNKRRDVEIEQPETHSLHERSPDVTVPINDTISLKEYTAPRTWTPKSKNVRIRDSETHRLEKRRISSRCVSPPAPLRTTAYSVIIVAC